MHAEGADVAGARWQASVLAAIYVDFTSGLREITLVGPAIGQSGGRNERTRADTGHRTSPAASAGREGGRQ